MAGSPKKRAKRARSEKHARAAERIAALPRNKSLVVVPPPEEPKDRWGRPTKFRPEYVAIVRILCEEGFTDREIAEELEINRATLYEWKRRHPELAAVLKIGKQLADDRVDRTAYELAVGYTTTVTETLKLRDQYGNEKLVTHTREVTIPPDKDMVKWWQKNRDPENWKDKTEQHVSGKVEHELLTVEQMRERVQHKLEDLRRRQRGVDDQPE